MKFTILKKTTIIPVVLFPLVWLVGLLRTYSPERSYPYTKEGALLFIFLASTFFIVWLVKRKGLAHRGAIVFFVWLSVLWFCFSVSSLLNLSDLPHVSIIGLFNSIAWQASVLVFAITWVSLMRDINVESIATKLSVYFGGFGLLASLAALQLLFTEQTLLGPLAINVSELRWPQLYGWFASPNYLVDTVAMGTIVAFFLYVSGHVKKIYASIFLLMMLVFLVGTGSRGGILACMMALLWQFSLVLYVQNGLRNKIKHIRRYALLTFFALTAGISALFLYVSYMGRDMVWFMLNVLRLRSENITSGSGRLEIWQNGVDVFSSGSILQLIFGIGNNAYVESYGDSLHNTYLQVLIDHGLLTLSVFLLFVCWYYAMVIRLAKRYKKEPRMLHIIAFISTPAAYVIVKAIFQGPVFLSGNISWCFMIISGVIISSIFYNNVPVESK